MAEMSLNFRLKRARRAVNSRGPKPQSSNTRLPRASTTIALPRLPRPGMQSADLACDILKLPQTDVHDQFSDT